MYGQIKETSIVFIQDVQKIWTHGKIYDCSSPDLSKYLTAEDLASINNFINNSSVSKTGETLTVKMGGNSESITNTWRTIQCDGSSIGSNTLNLKPGSNISLTNNSGVITINASQPTSLPANGGTADKANKLTTARTIDGVDFNGASDITHYGTCSTAAGTVAKTVSLSGYKLAAGAKVAVKFTVTNTAANPTLNVNSTGAKSIFYRGAAISAGYLAAGRVYEFVYDGTNYELIGDINTDTNTKVTSEANHYTPSATATDLSADAVAGTASWNTPVVTGVNLQRDSKGHIVGITVDSINTPAKPTDNNTAHAHSAGTGLSISGSGGTSGTTTYSLKTASTDEIGGVKVGKDNSSYAVTASTSSISADVTSGKYYAVEVDKNDKAFVYVPWTDTNDDTKVTSAANHYTPATNSDSTLSVDASGGSAAWSKQVVTGVNIQRDAKGHVTGLTVDSAAIPANPNTDTKVTSVANHYAPAEDTAAAISAASGTATNITGTSGKLNVVTGLKRDAKGHIVGVTSANIYSTDNNTAHAHTAGTGLTISGSGGTSGTTTYAANLKDTTALTIDSAAATTTSGKVYPVAVDKSGYLAVNVPWKNDNTTQFTITASASDDDVVVLSGTNGTNATTYTASHAKTFGNTTAPYTAKYTSGNSTTSISGYGSSATIKIPQITVDEYGHVRAGADESVTITMPSAQTIPTLSGGSAAETGKYVSGVTVSGHAVTVTKGNLPTIPSSLKNPNALSFGSKSYDGSSAQTITAADLGLGQAMRYIGKTSTSLSESTTSNTITIDSKSVTAQQGDVVIDKDSKKEYIWNGSSWEELGNEGNYKVKQTAVSSPSASGSTTAFIDTISQDTNGVITITKKNLAAATNSVIGGLKLYNAAKTTSITPNSASTTSNRYYAVELDKDGKAFVNVPWTDTDTNTTYSAGTGISLSGTTFSHADTNTNISTDTSYGPTANVTQSAKNTATFKVPQITLDQFGHVKSVTERTITVTDTNTDTDTHYTTGINAGSSGTTSNTAATNPYITVKDNSTNRGQIQLKGSGTVSIASDTNGVITITGTAHPTSLKNPNSISFKDASNTTRSYDGSSALDLTGGVYYAATAGSATSAGKLSTVSKTAWGQTYWTSGGVPTNISGAMTGVTDITMSGAIKMGNATISYDSTQKCIKFSF